MIRDGQGRLLPARDYMALKGACRTLTDMAGGVARAASLTRVDLQRISRYGRLEEPACYAPLDVVADLEADAGKPVVTDVLADLSGCVLIPKPPASKCALGIPELTHLAKESGEAIARLGEALGDDGKVTADEIRRLELRREVREAMETLAVIDRALRELEG